MRTTVNLNGLSLEERQYCEVIKAFTEQGYAPIIDPRQFDAPISIKARFKAKENKIRFIEFSPSLELSIEHELTKTQANTALKKLQKKFEEFMVVGSANVEDYEVATLQMIARRNPVIFPKNDAEEKLFQGLETKKIFSRALSIKCPKCKQAFMVPFDQIQLDAKKIFCVDCLEWIPVTNDDVGYIINEEYMQVMGSVWEKVQKMVRSSWREVIKRGMPVIKSE